MKNLLLIAAPILVEGSSLRGGNPWKLFTEFKDRYNMDFQTQEEDQLRFENFKMNMKKAEDLGKKDPTATFGVSKFAHLTKEEFKAKHTGFKKNPNRKRFPKKQVKKVRGGSIDWRDLGAVSPVKDQGACGSCWAFSATEAVESGYFKATGSMKILSPQQLVSCDQTDLGCNGGDTATAYQYIEQAGGLETEDDYPYVSGTTEMGGRCKADRSEFEVKVTDFQTISQDGTGEDDMYSQIQDSPMSICVDAESWQMYMGGVVTSATCGDELDHCVHLVGMKEGDYWIVKNSWNTDWGEDGYIRVKTGQNACGVAMEATTASANDEDAKKKTQTKIHSEQDLIDVMKGLSEGFGLHMEEDCVSSGESLMVNLEEAMKDLQKKTPEAVMEALEMVSKALETDWPAAQKACGSTVAEIQKIFGALAILKHPKEFAYHVGQDLMVNGVDIYKNVNDSVGHWKGKEFHDFGFSMGTALSELIVGTSDEFYV